MNAKVNNGQLYCEIVFAHFLGENVIFNNTDVTTYVYANLVIGYFEEHAVHCYVNIIYNHSQLSCAK